jgi:DNA-directed RNA polymerase subunit RPC12/RpoP
VDASCPLCGSLILTMGRSGRVTAAEFHSLPLYRRRGSAEGFAVCDDCGRLAELPDLTLN